MAIERTFWMNDAAVGVIPALAACAEAISASTEVLAALRARAHEMRPASEARRLVRRLDGLLGQGDRLKLDPGEPWAARVSDDLQAMSPPERRAWHELLSLGYAAEGPRPSKRWLAQAHAALDAIGAAAFSRQLVSWMRLVAVPASDPNALGYRYGPGDRMKDENARSLRGLVWAAALLPDAALARAVADLGLVCLTKLADVGPYSERTGNACIHALATMPCPEAAAELSRLRLKVHYVAARRLIETAFEVAAQREGVTPEEIEETTVPTLGLGAEGRRQVVGPTGPRRYCSRATSFASACWPHSVASGAGATSFRSAILAPAPGWSWPGSASAPSSRSVASTSGAMSSTFSSRLS